MAKEIRWIKDGYYREECSGNWEPVFFNSPPDSERVRNIKKRIAELQALLVHIQKNSFTYDFHDEGLQNNRE